MNIKDAKKQIRDAITAYLTKDQFGNYAIPVEQQRPIFLMGPPGIGKTAIMQQIASELGVGLVSYSMTHHTRQSALGLPFIVKKVYGGHEYQVSEYTMSEIIASVYDLMEETGVEEGILFLDEINCVSETLAPSMLQFLQYKIFGRHRVPEGWIVVTAGNPPEYNNSVREFDIVTWDRLKRIDVEPDYEVWKEHACEKGIHPAITTYLDIKKGDFYKIETTVDGKSFVTARGWSDLSDMIRLYEQHNLKVDENLVAQYVQHKQIAKDFSVYYDLFNKYKSDYQVDKILEGRVDDNIKERAANATFDERLSLLGLILDSLAACLRNVAYSESVTQALHDDLVLVREELSKGTTGAEGAIANREKERRSQLKKGRLASSLSRDDQYVLETVLAILQEECALLKRDRPNDDRTAFGLLKADFEKRVKALKEQADNAGKKLSNVFSFFEEVFSDGQEMLILVTELTRNYYAAKFISHYGCEAYFAHNKELQFYERQKQIITEIENFEL